MYTSATVLLNKISSHGLEDKISLCGEESEAHFNKAIQVCQSTGVTLPSEHIVVAMTPYSVDESDPEFHYQFDVIEVEFDCPYFENSQYYGEEKFDWLIDAISKKTFTVYGRERAQQIFGFLASQFFY